MPSDVCFRFVARNQGFVLGLENKGFCKSRLFLHQLSQTRLQLSFAASCESSTREYRTHSPRAATEFTDGNVTRAGSTVLGGTISGS
jgi:hypothetical protein